MGDRLRAGIPPWHVTKPTRSTQPCIPLGSLNRLLALTGRGKGGNVTSAGWQVTLYDPIWHVSSRSGAVLAAQTAVRFFTFFTFKDHFVQKLLSGQHTHTQTRTGQTALVGLLRCSLNSRTQEATSSSADAEIVRQREPVDA